MAKITVGKCENCGRELKVKEGSAKSIMHLTCKCGWHGYVGDTPGDVLKCKNCGERIATETYKANRGLCSECAKDGTTAKLRRIPQWQCPHCKTIFLKGREFQENQRFFEACGGMAAVSCAHCGHPLDGNALYGGGYDYREGSPSPSMIQPQQPSVNCFVCQRAITETERSINISCDTCGFSGTAHNACLGIPAFGVMLGFVQNVCPRCKEKFSKPVEGVEETLIDEIIVCLDAMDRVDRLPLPVDAKLSAPSWTIASARLAEIGNQINKKGGFDLMQQAFKRVHNKSGRRGSYLDRAWDGIGQWEA
jgi:hypothetical protein